MNEFLDLEKAETRKHGTGECHDTKAEFKHEMNRTFLFYRLYDGQRSAAYALLPGVFEQPLFTLHGVPRGIFG